MGSPLLILLILSFILAPTASLLLDNGLLVIYVRGNHDYIVFVDALYPSGFENIGKTFVRGSSIIQLDISGLRDAWKRELESRGRYAPITLRIAAYDDYGLAYVKIIRVEHGRIVNIVIDNEEVKNNPENNYQLKRNPAETTVQVRRVLEDYFEYNKTVIVAVLDLDNTSFGTLHYTYLGGGRIGFTVYLVNPTVELAGWVSYSRNNSIRLSSATGTGGKLYVWMTFKYRWEKWRVWGPGLPPEGLIEEYIYIIDFYPNTAKTGHMPPSNAVLPEIDSWNTSTYQALETDLPYFQATYGTPAQRYSSIDLTSFAETLLALHKITSNTLSSIKAHASSIGVDSCINRVQSYIITIDIFSTIPGSRHEVKIGEDQVNVTGLDHLPVYYIETVER